MNRRHYCSVLYNSSLQPWNLENSNEICPFAQEQRTWAAKGACKSDSDKGWFTKELKLLKHWVMRVSPPNNLALEKQKFIFFRYNFKVTRLNKEYRYCRHNRIKLPRRECISIIRCISTCPAFAAQEPEFRRKAWWKGQLGNTAKYCFPSN